MLNPLVGDYYILKLFLKNLGLIYIHLSIGNLFESEIKTIE
jgi:hypothetical protein